MCCAAEQLFISLLLSVYYDRVRNFNLLLFVFVDQWAGLLYDHVSMIYVFYMHGIKWILLCWRCLIRQYYAIVHTLFDNFHKLAWQIISTGPKPLIACEYWQCCVCLCFVDFRSLICLSFLRSHLREWGEKCTKRKNGTDGNKRTVCLPF